MTNSPPSSLLADLPDAVLWSSRTWPDFARARGGRSNLALLPVFGMADWGLGRAIDLEETLGCGVLRALLAADEAWSEQLTILPPLRFALGPYPHSLFPIDYETALDLMREIGESLVAAGIRRMVMFNSSPWNEELMETCACDLRAGLGLQTFVINLESLGLDLHPVRSSTRTIVQAVACALSRRPPANDAPRSDCRLIEFRPGDIRQPPPLALSKSLDASVQDGWTALAEAGTRFARLLAEIAAHPALAHDGAIPIQAPPAGRPDASGARRKVAQRKTRRQP